MFLFTCGEYIPEIRIIFHHHTCIESLVIIVQLVCVTSTSPVSHTQFLSCSLVEHGYTATLTSIAISPLRGELNEVVIHIGMSLVKSPELFLQFRFRGRFHIQF